MGARKFFILHGLGSQGTFPGKDLFPFIESLRPADDIAVNALEGPLIQTGSPAEEINRGPRYHPGTYQHQHAAILKKEAQCQTLNDYFCFFIYSHSTFDVGRSMFDVLFSAHPTQKQFGDYWAQPPNLYYQGISVSNFYGAQSNKKISFFYRTCIDLAIGA
jgi:hypothetical protein